MPNNLPGTAEETEVEETMRALMKRVEALDPELHRQLSDAICSMTVEAEELAVIHHGEQILSVIEGRGYAGRGNVWGYDEDAGLGQAASTLKRHSWSLFGTEVSA